MPPDSDGKGCFVVGTELRKVVPDAEHLTKIQDAVHRVHRIVLDATELMALHLSRCLESNIALPRVDASWIKNLMMEVSEGNGKRKRVDANVSATVETYMPELKRTNRKQLDNIMMAESNSLAACFNTNLWFHFRKRMKRFVRWWHPTDASWTKEKKKLHALQVLKITSDLCKPKGEEFESDDAYHAWIEKYRTDLGLSEICSWSMEDVVKTQQELLLRATWLVNKEYEEADEKCISCWPIRRRFRPAFCQIDTKAVRNLLGLDKEYDRYQSKRRERLKQQKKEYRTRVSANRAAINLPIIPRSKLGRQQATELKQRQGAKDAAKLIQRAWRSYLLPRRLRLLILAKRTPLLLIKAQYGIRAFLENHRASVQAHEQYRDQAKADSWQEILQTKAVKVPKKMEFGGSIRTDGISVRLYLKPKIVPKGNGSKKRKRNEDCLPSRGLFAIDALKHFSRLAEAEVIGADPGKSELLVCANVSTNNPLQRRYHPSVRLTSAQRRHETKVPLHVKKEKKELPSLLDEHIQELSSERSRASSLNCLQSYFQKRRTFLEEALGHYGENIRRKRHWERHRLGQQVITNFVSRIHALRVNKEAPVVLAYGSWSNVAGRPGMPCNRGHPPCLGIGLRRKLSKHFLVAVTPEAFTSKTCSKCGCICGPCEEVESERRKSMMKDAKTEKEKKKASRFTIRGLRRCTSDRCGVFWNRDYNAAVNIGRRFQSMYESGSADLPEQEGLDLEFEKLQAEVNL